MITPASSVVGRKVLRRLGVAPGQYLLLVRLFGMLGDRKELFGNLGMDRHALRITSLALLLPGLLFGLMMLGSASLGTSALGVLTVSGFVLMLLLVMEASNSFFNPAEVVVLAHRPIGGATYFAAKLTYLVVVVLRAQAALNGPAALAGLIKPEARWFYPLTHMAAAYGMGLFIALVTCALFGVLFRVLPASRLRSAALWVQLVATTVPLLFNLVQRPARRLVASMAPAVPAVDWSFAPVTWFTAIAVAGQGQASFVPGWPAAVGMAVSAIFIAYGLRALSAGYMTRIVSVMRASGRGRPRAFGPSWGSRLAGWLGGRPSAAAAWDFLLRMMRRDWQFRRAVLPLGLMVFVGMPALLRSGRATSPFDGGLAAMGLMPEIVPLGTLMVCLVITFSDHYRGAWIFAIADRPARRAFVRAIFWTLWVPFIAVPFAALGAYVVPYWGAIDTLVFTAYGMAVGATLVMLQLLFVDGLPFGSPPRPERTHALLPLLLFGPMVVGVAWVLQGRYIFQNRAVTIVAAVLFAAAAWRAARFTLPRLEGKIDIELDRLGGASSGMVDVHE